MTAEHNKNVARKFFLELCNKWNFDLFDELIHDDYEVSDHSASIALRGKLEKGKIGFIKRLKHMSQSLPDTHYRILKIIAEDDGVIVWWALKGTQVGEFMGFPPKGQSAQVFGTNYFKMKDGKIISNILNFDTFSFLIQLGHVSIKTDEDQIVMQYLKHLENINI